MGSPLARAWDLALDVAFPRRCVACGTFGDFLCDPCVAASRPAAAPRCEVCWMPYQRSAVSGQRPGICARCRIRPPAFTAARSAFVYEGAIREAVHALKYTGLTAIAPVLGAMMAERFADWAPPVDAIVAVPLAGHRLRERGYNQTELLARELSRVTGLAVARESLVRKGHSQAQARQPDEDARRASVASAFAAGRRSITGSVLLLDDVLTTGATLDACARVLLSAGADTVFVLTLARED